MFNESSLARVYTQTQHSNVGIICAATDGLDPEERKSASGSFQQDIRDAGYGFIPIEGMWTEKAGTPNEVKSQSVSICWSATHMIQEISKASCASRVFATGRKHSSSGHTVPKKWNCMRAQARWSKSGHGIRIESRNSIRCLGPSHPVSRSIRFGLLKRTLSSVVWQSTLAESEKLRMIFEEATSFCFRNR